MKTFRLTLLAACAAPLIAPLAACFRPNPPPPPAAVAPQPSPALSLQAVNQARFQPAAEAATPGQTAPAPATVDKTPDPALLKAEVLLDRANVSPGVMDGRMGQNLKNALTAYQNIRGLAPSGALDQATWNSLTAADKAPALKVYTLTPQDVAGPWSPDVGEDFVKMSKLAALGYTSSRQMLAQRFHMDEQLLVQLNPGADLTKAGTQIVVVDPGAAALAPATSIEVDKAREEVIAYDASHTPVGVFPATVGSTTRPSPVGTWKVVGVSQNPDYMYDPAKLTWGPKHAGKLHIPPGPNNPVGGVWIALSAPDYGIHGSPDPHMIGKTASHGCVRLTNWDAEELSKAVKPGVKVVFLSEG